MKFPLAILFTASIAAAAPTSENSGHSPAQTATNLERIFGKRQYDWRNDPWVNGIEKRAACGLWQSPDAGQGSSIRGFRILGHEPGAEERYDINGELPNFVHNKEEGKCTMIWCDDQRSYGSAFYLCREKGNKQQEYKAETIANQLHATFFFCYGHEPTDDDVPVRAYRYYADDYSLIVQGDEDCSKMDKVTFDAAGRVKGGTCDA